MTVKVGIIGLNGRMGQAIAHVLQETDGAQLAAGLVQTSVAAKNSSIPAETILTTQPEEFFQHIDVAIDFSVMAAAGKHAECAAAAKCPFVCGITGLSKESLDVFEKVSQHIPVLYASNTSLSLIVMKKLAKYAAQLLADHDYDIAIIDEHHRWKVDAPSGTAKTLAELIMEGNKGKHMPRFSDIRAGGIVGEHEVIFAGLGETIRLRHSVTDRTIFARGAVTAALWLARQQKGLYKMDDVLETPTNAPNI